VQVQQGWSEGSRGVGVGWGSDRPHLVVAQQRLAARVLLLKKLLFVLNQKLLLHSLHKLHPSQGVAGQGSQLAAGSQRALTGTLGDGCRWMYHPVTGPV